MKDEIMKNYSLTLYPSTHKIYMELKGKEGWTHDQIIKELIQFYEEKKE